MMQFDFDKKEKKLLEQIRPAYLLFVNGELYDQFETHGEALDASIVFRTDLVDICFAQIERIDKKIEEMTKK